MLPFKGRNRVTQIFSTKHGGIDIVGDDSTQISSVTDGTVDLVQFWDGKTKSGSQSYGNLVRVLTDDGKYIYYAHLAKVNVAKGQKLKCGDIIGIMGNSGNSFGAHLHLEARTGKKTSTRISPSQICSIENTKGIYCETDSVNITTDTSKINAISKGMLIELDSIDLYVSATASNAACKKSGTFYIYDARVVNGRIRITCDKSYVGRKPVGRFVTGWVNTADISEN